MANLVFVLIALALLGGFFALTWYEAGRGARVFAGKREELDRRVARIEFILAHVDFAAFVKSEVRRAASRIGHDAVHLSLQAVRAVERVLTRAVRYLRERHAAEVAPRSESSRPFVKSLADFKDRLKASRPEHPPFDGGDSGDRPG